MARPTRLTPEVQQRVTEAIAVGTPYQVAATYAGIDYSTFRRWMVRGEKAKTGVYRTFYEAVEQAKARCAVSALADIKNASRKGSYRASAWLLERVFPEHFRQRAAEAPAGDGKISLTVIDEIMREFYPDAE